MHPQSSLRVGVLALRLDLPGVHSLKEKRRIVKGLLQRTRQRFELSAAEVAYQDTWQSAGLGFALIGNDTATIQSRLNRLLDYIETQGEGFVVDYSLDILT